MKTFFVKSLIVVLLYVPAQYIYYKYTNDAITTTPLMLKVINNVDEYKTVEFVSFGSSIEYMSHPKDADRRTMTQRLETYLPERDFIALSQPAFTIKILDAFVKFYHRKVKTSDQFYLIELNMDQFSVTDNKRFLDRTPERLNYGEDLKAALYRPLSIFNYDYGVLPDKEFEEQKIYLDGEYKGRFDDLFNGEHLSYQELYSNRYMIQYLYELDNSHEKISYLRNLIKFIKQEEIDCLFYITPFDYQSCELYFEESLCSKIIDANIKVVTDVLDENGIVYLNLTKALSKEYIATTPMAPNGHLKSEGKEYNAKRISEWIKSNLTD